MSTVTVVHGAEELVVGPAGDPGPPDSVALDTITDGAVAIVDGTVEAVGPSDEIRDEYGGAGEHSTEIDASGRAVLPGLVDAHTHAVFAGDRSDEFVARLEGRSYQEIHAEGGGIRRTVRATREADVGTLTDALLDHLDAMVRHGTTTVEVKSGYGLETETELRMLEAMARADERHPVDVVPTFMGAHAVPADQTADEYVEQVVTEQLPAVAEQGVAEYCDVFCEVDAFTVEQSRRILTAAREHDLGLRIHAEEFERTGGAQLAADLGAASADHLLHASAEDAAALADAGVTPVVLPTAAFGLGEDYADIAVLRDAGLPIAVATDFNPACHSRSLPFAVALACVEMGMTPAEAIAGATANGARALERPDRGRLEPGSPGDLVVLDAPSHRYVPYSYGENLVETVLIDGEPVVADGALVADGGPVGAGARPEADADQPIGTDAGSESR